MWAYASHGSNFFTCDISCYILEGSIHEPGDFKTRQTFQRVRNSQADSLLWISTFCFDKHWRKQKFLLLLMTKEKRKRNSFSFFLSTLKKLKRIPLTSSCHCHLHCHHLTPLDPINLSHLGTWFLTSICHSLDEYHQCPEKCQQDWQLGAIAPEYWEGN